jgi:hypothetical protein
MLKAEWRGKVGWYSVVIPVSRWLAMALGRYLGFNKYIADEIVLKSNEETWYGSTRYRKITQLTMEFQPGITCQLEPWEKEMMDNESFFKDDRLVLVPPAKGPRVQRIIIRHKVSARWAPQPGMVSVTVDPSEIWAGLVPKVAEFPGTYNYFLGGFNIEVQGT